VSHSSRDSIEALALKTWLERSEPGVVCEVFVDLDPDTAIRELRTSGDQKLFVILGPSGVGMSSFLRAGVLQRLRATTGTFWPTGGQSTVTLRQLFGKHLLRAQSRCAGRAQSRVQAHQSASHERTRDRLRSAAHPAFSVETGLRIWPRLRPTDRPRAGVTSHSTRIDPLSVGTRVLGRWHAATVHFLCP
jgi:hypothetical protein